MAFHKHDDKKGLSLPGLIDIIFLLLIFSLVTLSISEAKVETKRRGDRGVDFDLPESMTKDTEEVDQVLQTLLFQIEHQNSKDPTTPKVIWVLKPSLKDSLTLQGAKSIAERDSLFRLFPIDFLNLTDLEFGRLPACQLINKSIDDFKKNNFFKPDLSNSIEVRAIKNTEFRIVNYILKSCSAYGDTIPRVVLRTLTAKEEVGGI